MTIDAGETGGRSEETFRSQRRGYDYGTRGTYVNYSGDSNIFVRAIGSFIRALMNGSRLAQIAVILIGVAFAALMFFIALPILFFILAVGIALLALSRILS